MTITLTYDVSTQLTMWLLNPQVNEYTLTAVNKGTNETYSTLIDNISGDQNQYALFNIISIANVPGTPSNNVIYLPHTGEYRYTMYSGIVLTDDKIVESGLLINEYIKNMFTDELTYNQTDNNKVVYGE